MTIERSLLEAALAWIWVAAVAALLLRQNRHQRGRLRRLARMRPPAIAPATTGEPPAPSSPPQGLLVLEAVGRAVSTPLRREKWRLKLQEAYPMASIEAFFGRVALSGAAVAVVAGLVARWASLPAAETVLLALLAGTLGVLWFFAHLRTLRDLRHRQLQEALPDLFDFLAVSLAAGLTLDAALGYVVPQLEGAAHDAFQSLLHDLHVGSSRREAFTRLAQRTGLEALERLTLLIVQSDQLGTGLHEALRAEAQRLREERLGRARERAGRLPVQMTFPIVAFLLPALYALLLAPALIDILHSVGGGL